MSLRRVLSVKQGMVWFKSGHIYNFRYSRYENDPEPTIICLCAVKGTHERTGHRHNYIQGINFTYIPRNQRRQFVKVWVQLMKDTKGHVLLSWQMIEKRWPYMRIAIRRYILDKGFIQTHKEIPIDDIEKVVVGTWHKDFSLKAIRAYVKGLRKFR
jgi:hypothetical protein